MEKNKKSSFGKVLLIIIVLLVVCGGCTYLGMTYSDEIKSFLKVDKKDSKTPNDKVVVEEEEKVSYEITYTDEEYVTKKTDGTIVSRSTRNLPVIKSSTNQSQADKIVSYLTNVSDDEWNNDIKKQADEITTDDFPYSGVGANYLFSTGVVNNGRLTFILTLDGGFGGVSWSDVSGYNFDAKTGSVLTINSLAEDANQFRKFLRSEVDSYIDNNIKNQENNCLLDDYSNSLDDLITTTGNWYFTDNNFTLSLPKYSIACGAAGVIEIEIDKDKINSYLKDEYKI